MLRKNGASDKLLKGIEEPKFERADVAKTYKSSQEFFYQRDLEIETIRTQYRANAPQQEVQNTFLLVEARKQADKLSKQNSLVPFISDEEYKKKQESSSLSAGVTDKQADKLGLTTYKKVMTKKDAERIVKKSNGFLTAVDAGNDMMEIKPSLPEEVTVNGQKVRVRKVWNLLVKSSIMMVTNEDGSFKTDNEALQKGSILTNLLSVYRSMEEKRETYEKDLRDSYVPVMAQILKKGYEDQGLPENAALDSAKKEAADICKELLILLDANENMMPLLPQEIALENYVESIRNFNDINKNIMSKYLKGYKFREVKTVKKIIDGKEVSEDVITEREATEDEITEAIDGICKNVTDTKAAMKKLRELDVDSKVVPVPNTCSSNAFFYKNLQQICLGKPADILAYRTAEFVRANPQKVLDFLKKNLYLIGDAQGSGHLEEVHSELEKLSFRENPEGLNAAERAEEAQKIKKLVSIAQNYGKYIYHAAAHIFSDEDDGDLTVEGFAAGTDQFMVEPFTMHAAIGQYHGSIQKVSGSNHEMKQEGFSAFYNADKPYATDKVELLKIYLKSGLKKHGKNFTDVALEKEAEAEKKRQEEERKRKEQEEKERLEREEKERKEYEAWEKEHEAILKKFENMPGDPDVIDEFFINASKEGYFNWKENNENARRDAQRIKENNIENEVLNYTGEDYKAYNGYLRYKDYEDIREEQKEEVHRLKDGLNKCRIDRTLVVNRGFRKFKLLLSMFGLEYVPGSSDEDMIQQVLSHVKKHSNEGKDIILTDPGFVSTCYDAGNKFTDLMMPKGVELVIKVNKGTAAANISKISAHEDEQELLLNAGTKFRLIKIYNAGPNEIEGLERRKISGDILHDRENSKKGSCLKIYLETIPQQEDGILK